MSDPFLNYVIGRESPAMRHYQISPSADPLNPRPRALYVASAGSVTIEDSPGESLVYQVVTGQILPISAYKVTAATATIYGWL